MATKSYLKPQTKAVIQVLWWTFCLLTGLTFINFVFVLHIVGPGIQLEGLQLNFSRQPASQNSPQQKNVLVKTPLIEINCNKSKQEIKLATRAPTARIQFTNCQNIAKVVNTTNSNQGDVFPLKNGRFTSDFIFLNKGPNRVEVVLGEGSYEIQIHRQFESSKNSSQTM